MESSSFVFREGLEWADIDWVDNGECLDLIEKVSRTVLIKGVFQIVSLRHTFSLLHSRYKGPHTMLLHQLELGDNLNNDCEGDVHIVKQDD